MIFENSASEELSRIVDSQFSKTRVTIKVPWIGTVIYEIFIEEIREIFNKEFGKKKEITLTGLMSLMARTVPAALDSMGRSYIIAFIVITFMMMMLVESVRVGLISMIPNLLPIFIVMGLMGLTKVPLDMSTLMIGSIAIGLVVDDTVHFMYNFQKYYRLTGDSHQAIKETLLGTGRALLTTSVVLSSAFFILLAATMKNTMRFGFYTGLTIILALLADFIVAPALMVIYTNFINNSNKP